MAERPYVRHRARPSRAAQLAPVVGIVIAAATLAAVAWGVTALTGTEEPPPPPPVTKQAVAKKPALKIVFPEGFTRAEMAQRIAAVNKIAKRKRKITPKLSPRQYLRLTKRAKLPKGFAGAEMPHLEGFLFPATYEFTAKTTTRALVRKQLEAFERAWGGVDLDYAQSKNLSAYEVLIIASMIEEEVLVPRERSLVAAVIYNRLRIGLPLGIDATIRYGLDVPATESLRESHLADPTPYNTRIHQGLPPTPISNPGLASIQAAAHPAQSEYLYFVRKADCKSHFFTADEDEFYAALDEPRC